MQNDNNENPLLGIPVTPEILELTTGNDTYFQNDWIWEIHNTNQNIILNPKRDYAADNAAKEQPSYRSGAFSATNRTAVGYDVAKGQKRAKAARKSRKINQKK